MAQTLSKWASTGRGRHSPAATRTGFEDPTGLVAHLVEHRGLDAWWSPHVWERNRRKSEEWVGACAVVIDIDYYDASGTHAAPASSLMDAVVAYRRAHPLEVPRNGGTCPICGHNDCFGRLPTDTCRWFCFSDRHEADGGGVGVRGSRGWHGDVLDLHAHANSCSRSEWLRRTRYLRPGTESEAKPGAADGKPGTPLDPFADRWFPLSEDWTEEEPPPQRWLVCARRLLGFPVEGLIARGVVALLAGPGGVGKTEVLIGLGIAIATGGMWIDHFPVDDATGRVLVLAAEEDVDEMRRRVHRQTRRLPKDERTRLHGRIVVVPMHARNIALLARASKTSEPTRTRFLQSLRDRLSAEGGPDGWAAIIMGPLSRLAGVAIDADNENATALVQVSAAA